MSDGWSINRSDMSDGWSINRSDMSDEIDGFVKYFENVGFEY